MLLIELFAPRGALDERSRRHIPQRLVTAVMSAPDAAGMREAVERSRAQCHAVVHEPEAWSVGGTPVDTGDPPRYLVRVSLPARHLNDAMRAELVARVTRVLAEADEDPDRAYREPTVWVYVIEVADGNMGAMGRVLRLTDLMGMVLDGRRAATGGGRAAAAGANAAAVDPVCGMRSRSPRAPSRWSATRPPTPSAPAGAARSSPRRWSDFLTHHLDERACDPIRGSTAAARVRPRHGHAMLMGGRDSCMRCCCSRATSSASTGDSAADGRAAGPGDRPCPAHDHGRWRRTYGRALHRLRVRASRRSDRVPALRCRPRCRISALVRLAEWGTLSLVLQGVAVFPAIALGAWAARRRILDEPSRHRRLLTRLAVGGLVSAALGGLPFALIAARVWTAPPLGAVLAAGSLHAVSGYAGGLGYAALFGLTAVRLARRVRWGPVTCGLAACGQRSLSCYLAQSIVFAALLPEWTLGLGGQARLWQTAVLAAATWLVTVAVAAITADAGHRGPAGLLLRRLTYGAAHRPPGARTDRLAGREQQT